MKNEKLIKELKGKSIDELKTILDEVTKEEVEEKVEKTEIEETTVDETKEEEKETLSTVSEEKYNALKQEFDDYKESVGVELESIKDVLNQSVKNKPFGQQKKIIKDVKKTTYENLRDSVFSKINN